MGGERETAAHTPQRAPPRDGGEPLLRCAAAGRLVDQGVARAAARGGAANTGSPAELAWLKLVVRAVVLEVAVKFGLTL